MYFRIKGAISSKSFLILFPRLLYELCRAKRSKGCNQWHSYDCKFIAVYEATASFLADLRHRVLYLLLSLVPFWHRWPPLRLSCHSIISDVISANYVRLKVEKLTIGTFVDRKHRFHGLLSQTSQNWATSPKNFCPSRQLHAIFWNLSYSVLIRPYGAEQSEAKL